MKIDPTYLPTKPTKKAATYIDYLTWKLGIKTDSKRVGALINYLLNGTESEAIFSAKSDKVATYRQRKYINYLLYFGGKLTVEKYIYLMSRLWSEKTTPTVVEDEDMPF